MFTLQHQTNSDESTRPDRQPEFTQLDIELSFTDRDSIMKLIEDLLAHCWPVLDDAAAAVAAAAPFERITYADAMARYGCDKPDTRFGLQIRPVCGSRAHAILVPANTRGQFDVALPAAVAQCLPVDSHRPVHVLQLNREPAVWCKHNRVEGFEAAELAAIFAELNVQRNQTVLLAAGDSTETVVGAC